MAIPIYERRPYSNPGRTARMSDLMREEVAARSRGDVEAAHSSARMWDGLGRTIGGAMSDLAQYELDKPKRAAAAAAAEEVRQRKADDVAIKDVIRKSVDPETGRIDTKQVAREATLIDPEKAQTWWKAASDEDKAQLSMANQQATKVAQAAGAVLSLPGPMRQEAYARLRQEVIKDGAQADAIPEVYDETWLRTTRDTALTVAQQVDEFHRAATRTETERHNREMEQNARLGKAPDPAKAGTFEDYLGRVAKEKGKTTADLTTKEIATARQTFETAGRAPDKPERDTSRVITQAQRAAAERWKQDALRGVEKEFRDSKDGMTPMTSDELELRKASIQQSYLEQLGLQPRPLPTTPETEVPPVTQPQTTPARPEAMANRPTVGQIVSVRGQRVRITQMFPDGTFEAEPVP